MTNAHRRRRLSVLIAALSVAAGFIFYQISQPAPIPQPAILAPQDTSQPLAKNILATLDIKGRAPKTGYSRDQFGQGWAAWQNCDTRQRILARDLTEVKFNNDGCTILSGALNDPYTGKIIDFRRGSSTSADVQIDHVVALSDAWQKGAQNLTAVEREKLANDDLELLAVDGLANQQKGAGDAATWLPANKSFHCQYVARQIAIKQKYHLWVTDSEHNVMDDILSSCPDQRLPSP